MIFSLLDTNILYNDIIPIDNYPNGNYNYDICRKVEFEKTLLAFGIYYATDSYDHNYCQTNVSYKQYLCHQFTSSPNYTQGQRVIKYNNYCCLIVTSAGP